MYACLKSKWCILAILALAICIDIEFELLLIPTCSDTTAKATNNIILALSYSYIAAAIFYYLVNVLPFERRLFIIRPLLEANICEIAEHIHVCKEVIMPFSSISDKKYSKEEYAQKFEDANLYSPCFLNKNKSKKKHLEDLRADIKSEANLILTYREYMTDEQFRFVNTVLNSYFIKNGVRPYPKVDTKFRKDFDSNQYEIGACIYDLYEYSKTLYKNK